MELEWNDGTSLADGMGMEWEPEISEKSTEWGTQSRSAKSYFYIILGNRYVFQLHQTKLANLLRLSIFTQYGSFSVNL